MSVRIASSALYERLTLGWAPWDRREADLGDPDPWLHAQLHPGSEPAALRTRLAALETLELTPKALFDRYLPPRAQRRDPQVRREYRRRARTIYRQAFAARVLRGLHSPWQLRELLVDFWFNHFNVFAGKGLCRLWVGAFETQAIRPHVFGRFRDLLLATARHPAMLFYLDNWLNTAPGSPGARGRMRGLNENYAREVMELHTIGLGYTQADVAGATHLLTGWGLDRRTGFAFDPDRHDFSSQTVLGRRFSGGEAEVFAFLDFLAAHPATARHVSREMARYFVADRPADALVDHMAANFLSSKGDLRALTGAMIEHPAFARAAARRDKFRTPYRYVLATLRACGCEVREFRPLIGILRRLGQPLYGCLSPNGWPSTASAWLSPDALAARLDFAVALGGGWLPLDPGRPRGEPYVIIAPAAGDSFWGRRERAAWAAAPQRLRPAVRLGAPAMQYC